MNVQIPVKWLQELLALCGPEDHELRERVMVSITAMDEQAARAVALPEPEAAIVEVMELVKDWAERDFIAAEAELDAFSEEATEKVVADKKHLDDKAEEAYRAIETKLRALLATGGQAQAVEKSATHGMNLGQRILHVGGRENAQTYIEFGSVAAVRALVDQVLRDLPDGAPGFVLPAPQAQADARDAEQEVLMEHSGCGSNSQVDMLTVRLNPGDKVVMHKGRITQGFDRANRAAIAAAKGE